MVAARARRVVTAAAAHLRVFNGGGYGWEKSSVMQQRLSEDLGAQRPAGVLGSHASGTTFSREAFGDGGCLSARCHSGLGNRPGIPLSPSGPSVSGNGDGFRGTAVKPKVRQFHATARAMAVRDYYDVLGVSKTATQADIKKGFYAQAQKYHPDKNKDDPQAEKKFQEVQQAYETLKDSNKRAIYDQVGPDRYAETQNGAGGGPGFSEQDFGGFQGFGGGFGASPEDFFGGLGGSFQDLFRSSMGGAEASGGADVRLAMELSFREAVEGCVKRVRFSAPDRCPTCNGSGLPKGVKPERCRTCGGSGKKTMVRGNFMMQAPCGTCGGAGSVAKEHCRTCSGAGVVDKVQEVEVKIPAGIEPGMSVRVAGKGAAAPQGQPPGDLFLTVNVEPDSVFTRNGSNLHTNAPITYTQAALGGTVNIPTLSGDVRLKVKPGTQPGDKAVLRGKGVKILNRNGYGDHFVHFQLQVPTQLTNRQRELLEELAREEESETDTAQATA